MNDLKLPKVSKAQVIKQLNKNLRVLHSYQIIIISTLVLVLLGYAILEVGKLANTTITPAQEEIKKLELSQKQIEFDETVITEIQSRLRDDVEVNAQDLGTDNPFSSN